MRFTKVDDSIRDQHFFLGPDDDCYFMREYTARAGYSHSQTNDIILNLKKGMDRRGRPEWRYKEWAINVASNYPEIGRGTLDAQSAPSWLSGSRDSFPTGGSSSVRR